MLFLLSLSRTTSAFKLILQTQVEKQSSAIISLQTAHRQTAALKCQDTQFWEKNRISLKHYRVIRANCFYHDNDFGAQKLT